MVPRTPPDDLNFRCVLELALRETPGVELVSWDQGQDTWLRATIPGSPRRTVRVAPDARFILREAGQLRQFFLEMDRSTEEHRRLLQKYVGYWWYLQSPQFHQAYPGRRRANVLFVTTGQQRDAQHDGDAPTDAEAQPCKAWREGPLLVRVLPGP